MKKFIAITLLISVFSLSVATGLTPIVQNPVKATSFEVVGM